MSLHYSFRCLIAGCFLFCLAMTLAAKDYRIVRLTTPTIEIGGKDRKNGDSFDSGEPIKWADPRQAMKVVDLSTGIQSLIVGEKAKSLKSGNLEEYLVKNRRMSSRDGMPDNIITLRAMLEKEKHFLIDTIEVATAIPTDANRFFYVSYNYNGEEINKRIANSNGHFFITHEIFTIDGRRNPPCDITLSLFYLDETTGRLSLVTEKFNVYVLSGYDME